MMQAWGDTTCRAPLNRHELIQTPGAILEGSWYLLTNYSWANNPTYKWDNPYKAL